MYQLVSSEKNRARFINMANGVDVLNVTAERVNRRVQGYSVPHVRINILNTSPTEYSPAGCTDKCVAPAELQKSVRLLSSGPISSKAELIEMVDFLVTQVKSSDFDQVWNGFLPNPTVTITPSTGA